MRDGSPQQELRIATFRGSAARLAVPALVFIAVVGVTGYLLGNLPSPFEDWMLLGAAAGVVLVAVVIPWWVWASRQYILTTRRIIATRGLIFRRRLELAHAGGYVIGLTRGPLQRVSGTGTLVLSAGGQEIELRRVHNPRLISETLSDQIEISQILAHREAQEHAADPSLGG
ncbi:PH domain-containing protein [Microbacterium excoecariae]|uniref:PH domain-containing protein n=1 Tax=Microbacterium excoecariae TaxID=2715210 RepID=UPI00140E1F8F|nr:PH domain-containing protein [Microbacterium excoecariae]NHI17483.1 PH domain-containing protein [Microbacterium excoecariae]